MSESFVSLWSRMTPAERRFARRELEAEAAKTLTGSPAQVRASARKLVDRTIAHAKRGEAL